MTWTWTYTQYRCVCSDSSKTTNWGDGACKASDTGCTTQSQSAPGSNIYHTSKYACSTNATLAGCRTDTAKSAITLSNWRQKKFCFKNGGWDV